MFDEPRSYGLNPDILVDGDERIIMDTKWEFKPTPADMYQMFAYARRCGARKIILLLPAPSNASYRTEDLTIQVHGVDLFDMGESIKALLKS